MTHLDIMEFDCSVCLETKEEDLEQVELVADNWICSKCVPAAIVQPFEAALQHEINYPPIGFEEDWDERIKEYRTPVQRRIYCQGRPIADDTQDEPEDARFCDNFLGELGKGDMVECMRCGIWTCLKCRLNPYAPPEDEHFCIPPKADDSAAGTFDLEARGKEWQQCPNPDCSVKLALRSGCNHMTCHFCSTDFCMLCGGEAAPGNGHWTRQQGCPRYGGRDVTNPMFYDDLIPEEELDIVVGMVMLPRTDPPTAPTFTLYENIHVHAEKRTATTVWEDFVEEIPRLQWAACENGAVLKPIDGMRTLLHDLARNLEWVAHEWAIRDPAFEITVLDPVMEAVESVNFMIRHERLSSKLLQTLRAMLDLPAPSASFVLRGSQYHIEEIFAQYWFEYEPRVAEIVRSFVSERELGRTLFVRKADRVDRRAGKKDMLPR